MPTPEMLTMGQVRQFRLEMLDDGRTELVDACDRALAGDLDALSPIAEYLSLVFGENHLVNWLRGSRI